MIMRTRENKYKYLKIIQGSFGYGWEDLAEYNNNELQQLKADLREYKASGMGSYRVINRRELNNIKNKDMKKEIYYFICPVYYLPYIFNADVDGITEEETSRVDEVLSGYCYFSVKDEESFFSHQNDFNKLGADCVTLIAKKNERM